MAQKIVKHVKDMVAEANKEVEITPVVDASKYFEDSKYVFVDIRDPGKYKEKEKFQIRSLAREECSNSG